jgi:dTMP kinase
MSGRFITFEGGEGAGKSTQARLLAEHLRLSGLNVLETREPGGSPFAECVRRLILAPDTPAHAPLSEALLFTAARADHLEATIRPALLAGSWVICDRFTDSTRVYQGAAGGLRPDVLDALETLVVGETRPDLTFLLDLDPVIGLERAQRRGERSGSAADGYEARGLAYHERLRQGFADLARASPERIVTIDAMAAPGDVARRVREAVARRLGG